MSNIWMLFIMKNLLQIKLRKRKIHYVLHEEVLLQLYFSKITSGRLLKIINTWSYLEHNY